MVLDRFGGPGRSSADSEAVESARIQDVVDEIVEHNHNKGNRQKLAIVIKIDVEVI